MTTRLPVAGLVAAVLAVGSAGATAYGVQSVASSGKTVTAQCTTAPKVRVLDDGRQRISTTCTLPAPARKTVTVTASPAAPPPTTPSTPPKPDAGSSLGLASGPWSGGPAYYAQFPVAKAAGWTDPERFPISVFFGKPSQTQQLLDIGVNTLMGAERDGSTLESITRKGMHVLAQQEWKRAEIGDNPLVVGHHVADECEMGLSGCAADGAEGSLAIERRYNAALRQRDDGRFLQSNYGNGVLQTWWGRGTMASHVQGTDVSSVDKYAYTSPHIWDIVPMSDAWPNGAKVPRAATYGWLQDQMEKFQASDDIHPNWVFVETARPFLTETGATTIQSQQINGAVWAAIRHGALGIAYFQHNNNGKYGVYSLVDGPASLKAAVRDLNSDVQDLAPVINSPSLVWDAGRGTDTMLKTHDGNGYLFAGVGIGRDVGEQRFSLPIEVDRVTDVLTGRTIEVNGRSFIDSFPNEYTSRVYRFDL